MIMEERTNAERLIAELDQWAMLPFHQMGSIVGDFYDKEMTVNVVTVMLERFEEERIVQEQKK